VELLRREGGLGTEDEEEISDVSLCLFDAHPAELVGLREEFVMSGRIDNQLSTFAAFEALIATAGEGSNGADAQISIAAAFDHEEVGSLSATGADSLTVVHWLEKIFASLGASCLAEAVPRSLLISADCAHGSHPNYAAKSQPEHRVGMGRGVVIKHNANMRYATNSTTAAITRRIAEIAGVSVQDFVVKNDSPCGSTIGPSLAANLGVRTVDIGAPQWAMHSIRESCHVQDVANLVNLSKSFFTNFHGVERSFAPAL
jgi:aspartyl aminopeptidase